MASRPSHNHPPLSTANQTVGSWLFFSSKPNKKGEGKHLGGKSDQRAEGKRKEVVKPEKGKPTVASHSQRRSEPATTSQSKSEQAAASYSQRMSRSKQ